MCGFFFRSWCEVWTIGPLHKPDISENLDGALSLRAEEKRGGETSSHFSRRDRCNETDIRLHVLLPLSLVLAPLIQPPYPFNNPSHNAVHPPLAPLQNLSLCRKC